MAKLGVPRGYVGARQCRAPIGRRCGADIFLFRGSLQSFGISRGKESEAPAKKLGAHTYIDSSATDAAGERKKLGGARVILSTAPSGKAMASLVNGLGANGTMMVIGAGPDPVEVQTGTFIFGNKELKGWASGVAPGSEDTLRFAAYTEVRPMIEKCPLDKVNEAYSRMTSGKAQFRVVLTMLLPGSGSASGFTDLWRGLTAAR